MGDLTELQLLPLLGALALGVFGTYLAEWLRAAFRRTSKAGQTLADRSFAEDEAYIDYLERAPTRATVAFCARNLFMAMLTWSLMLAGWLFGLVFIAAGKTDIGLLGIGVAALPAFFVIRYYGRLRLAHTVFVTVPMLKEAEQGHPEAGPH